MFLLTRIVTCVCCAAKKRAGVSKVIGEGWASPLKGFMREGALLQTIHFASLLVDPANTTGETSNSSEGIMPSRTAVGQHIMFVTWFL